MSGWALTIILWVGLCIIVVLGWIALIEGRRAIVRRQTRRKPIAGPQVVRYFFPSVLLGFDPAGNGAVIGMTVVPPGTPAARSVMVSFAPAGTPPPTSSSDATRPPWSRTMSFKLNEMDVDEDVLSTVFGASATAKGGDRR